MHCYWLSVHSPSYYQQGVLMVSATRRSLGLSVVLSPKMFDLFQVRRTKCSTAAPLMSYYIFTLKVKGQGCKNAKTLLQIVQTTPRKIKMFLDGPSTAPLHVGV